MQAKRKLLPILLVVLIVVLALAACSGGGAGGQEKTWFNFPALPVNVKADGSVDVYGLGVPVALPAAQVQQLQALDAQRVEARAGANGIHVLLNGQDLPYVNWDSPKKDNLKAVLTALGYGQAADVLPWLSRVGLGVALKLPPAEGKSALSVPLWTGETSVEAQPPAEGVEPLNLGLISFGTDGKASIAGIPADTLAKLGVTIPQLTPEQLALIQTLGLQKMTVSTRPNGIDIVANDDQPWPGLAFDQKSVEALSTVLGGVLTPDQASMVQSALPLLTGRPINFTVGFNGQPPETSLKDIAVKVGPEGALNLLGFDVPGATLPVATVKMLQSANVQQVAIGAKPDSLALAVNGQSLPLISFSKEGLGLMANLVGAQAGLSPDLITTGLEALTKDGLSTNISLPPAGDAAPIEAIAMAAPSFAPADLGGLAAPVIHAKVGIKDGQIVSVGDLTADQLAAAGVALPSLPPAVMDILKSLGAKQVDIVSQPNQLEISVNGTPMLGLQYDDASLGAAWNLAKPFLADTALADPGLQKVIEEQILPLVPGADVNIAVTVE